MNIGKKMMWSGFITKNNNKYYSFSRRMNLFYSIDSTDGLITIMGSLPDENIYGENLCRNIICWHDELIFIPLKAEKIWSFNVNTKEWKNYEIKNEKIEKKFLGATLIDDKIYMIGFQYPAIICLDLIKGEVTYLFEDLFNQMNKHSKNFFRGSFVKEGDLYYIPSCNSNEVYIFNFIESKCEKRSVAANSKAGFLGITKYQENFWLIPAFGNSIYKWNGKEKITAQELLKENADSIFINVGTLNGEVYVIGRSSFGAYKINNNSLSKLNTSYELNNISFCNIIDDGEIIFGNNTDDIFILQNEKNIKHIVPHISDQELTKVMGEEFILNYYKHCFKEVSIEENSADLHMFIKCLE